MSELDFVSELLAGSRSRTNSGAYISEFISSGELYREVDLKTGTFAGKDAKKVKTDLGMKYGRTRYDIEAAGVEQMKFYEVAPHLSMTQHAITIRPICFSGKTFKKLPPDLQAAIDEIGFPCVVKPVMSMVGIRFSTRLGPGIR